MACIQLDENALKSKQNDVENQHTSTQPSHKMINIHSNQHQDDDSSHSPPHLGCNARWSPNIPPLGISKPIGWMDGLLGCMRPVVSLLVKSNSNDAKQKVTEIDWEIPFESITNLEWLGSGAQGTVFSGYLRNEIVAVKKVRDYKETDIKHLRRLDHENIIKFKGVCTQSPVFCIIMEFCPYGPLQNILKDEKVVQPVRIVSWAKQIALGMQYLHSHKIIHRDLKSPNILIGAHEIVKISDFGTSREWNEKSTKMSFAGTVSWRERKYFPVHKMSKRMTNTIRRIYKHNNLLCEQPEQQSSLSENTPEIPVTSTLYAELKDSHETRSVVVGTAASANTPISVSPKINNQKKIRHRRLGSADSSYTFILPSKQIDRRNVKVVHMETQTDIVDNVTEFTPNVSMLNDESPENVSVMLVNSPLSTKYEANTVTDEEKEVEKKHQKEGASDSPKENYLNNGNIIISHADQQLKNSFTDEQFIDDYMNSNEQLDIRESSDEDHVEKLNREVSRRVSQFFTQNRLLQPTDNGNGSVIDNRLLFNIMAARRSCISINDKDEVTVLSRGNGSTAFEYGSHTNNGDLSRRDLSMNFQISDHNCNNDDGDDSWTDEEGEESDRNYSLRRKSFARMPIGRTRNTSRGCISTTRGIRKSELEMSNVPSNFLAANAVSDEEGSTLECSHRHTPSSVYSTLESPIENVDFYAQQNIDNFHPQNFDFQNQNQQLNSTDLNNEIFPSNS